MISRRSFVFSGLALAAGAAWGGEFDPAPDAGFERWKAGFRKRALARGFSARVVDGALSVAEFLPGVIAKDRNQFEFSLSFEDYMAIAVSPDRVAAGQAALRDRAGLLGRIESRYGVESRVISALWGIESFYGTKRGAVRVVSSLATLAYEGRRASFFENQLLAALNIIARGEVSARGMTGGWAGAMGHTQVIPTTYLAFAQDFTGDGRADVWGEDPSDALATSAWYLRKSGWTHGQIWGQEVVPPLGMVSAKTRELKARSVKDWAKAGVRPARGSDFLVNTMASVISPAGPKGPAFLVTANFTALKRYNASDSYALGLGILSDRIAGGPGLVASFPPDRYGLTQADRIALQKGLTRRGFDTGSVNGVFGPKTTAAIKSWQRQAGLPVDGVPSMAMVAAVR